MRFCFLKRTLALFLVLCVIFGMAVGAHASQADPSAALTLSVSSSGNTVTAVVGLADSNIGISGIDFKLSFDNSKLDFTGASGSIFGFSFSSAEKANSNGYVYALGALNSGDTTKTGTVATLTFSLKGTASGKASFQMISGNASDTNGNSFTLNLPDATALEVAGYRINYKSAANGSVSGPASAASGSTVTLTAKPNTGYEVDTITVSADAGDTVSVSGGGNSYSFTMPAAYATVSASFKKVTYQISKGAVSVGGSVALSADSANYRQTVTVTATPEDGYEVDSIAVTGATLTDSGDGKYTFKMPASDVTVTANFKLKSTSATQNPEKTENASESVSAGNDNTQEKAEDETVTNSASEPQSDSVTPNEDIIDDASEAVSSAMPEVDPAEEVTAEESSGGNILVWILSVVLAVLIAVLVVLLVLKKRAQNW